MPAPAHSTERADRPGCASPGPGRGRAASPLVRRPNDGVNRRGVATRAPPRRRVIGHRRPTRPGHQAESIGSRAAVQPEHEDHAVGTTVVPAPPRDQELPASPAPSVQNPGRTALLPRPSGARERRRGRAPHTTRAPVGHRGNVSTGGPDRGRRAADRAVGNEQADLAGTALLSAGGTAHGRAASTGPGRVPATPGGLPGRLLPSAQGRQALRADALPRTPRGRRPRQPDRREVGGTRGRGGRTGSFRPVGVPRSRVPGPDELGRATCLVGAPEGRAGALLTGSSARGDRTTRPPGSHRRRRRQPGRSAVTGASVPDSRACPWFSPGAGTSPSPSAGSGWCPRRSG